MVNGEKVIAIIFAGGVGQRFGNELPKQFVEYAGKPIIIHTLEKFQSNENVDEIYIGCVEEWIPYLEELVEHFSLTKIPKNGIIPGGASGQDTIYQVLKQARINNTDDSIVLIHDGVRPNVTQKEINDNIEAVIEHETAITVIPLTQTPIYSEDGQTVGDVLNRGNIYCGIAPQSFHLGRIINAHEQTRKVNPDYVGIVDSCSLMKNTGMVCHMVLGNPANIKVTNGSDFGTLVAEIFMKDVSNFLNGSYDKGTENGSMRRLRLTRRGNNGQNN